MEKIYTKTHEAVLEALKRLMKKGTPHEPIISSNKVNDTLLVNTIYLNEMKVVLYVTLKSYMRSSVIKIEGKDSDEFRKQIFETGVMFLGTLRLSRTLRLAGFTCIPQWAESMLIITMSDEMQHM